MAGLSGWNALPLLAAAAALVLVAVRVRTVMFRAALDGPSFARELRSRLGAGRRDAAIALATRLRPAWAAEVALRALAVRDDPEELRYALEEARSDLALAAQRGLLAIRSLGRLALPLALAIAIATLGRGFDPAPELGLDRTAATGRALAQGLFAMSMGLAVSIGCQVSYGVLARAAKRRLAEVQMTSDVFERA